MNSTTKVCKDCGLEKPVEDFYKAADQRGGRRSYCKPCHIARSHRKRDALSVPWGTPEERFWKRVERHSDEECWPWTGTANLNFWLNGKTENARRYSVILSGREIGENRMVIAACQNLRCVNPWHLKVKVKGGGARHDYKICSDCGVEKPLGEFSLCVTGVKGRRAYCKPCWRERGRRDYQSKTTRALRADRIRKYGLTIDRYEAMIAEQGGVCAICGELRGKHGLVVDHDHITGMVRQLLCGSCNAGIAMFLDDPVRLSQAVAYLEKWATVTASRASGVG